MFSSGLQIYQYFFWKFKFGCHGWISFFCRSTIGNTGCWLDCRAPWSGSLSEKHPRLHVSWWQPVRWDLRMWPLLFHYSRLTLKLFHISVDSHRHTHSALQWDLRGSGLAVSNPADENVHQASTFTSETKAILILHQTELPLFFQLSTHFNNSKWNFNST